MKQCSRVRMGRMFEDLFCGSLFHDQTPVHHFDPFRQRSYHPEIVGDQNNIHLLIFI